MPQSESVPCNSTTLPCWQSAVVADWLQWRPEASRPPPLGSKGGSQAMLSIGILLSVRVKLPAAAAASCTDLF